MTESNCRDLVKKPGWSRRNGNGRVETYHVFLGFGFAVDDPLLGADQTVQTCHGGACRRRRRAPSETRRNKRASRDGGVGRTVSTAADNNGLSSPRQTRLCQLDALKQPERPEPVAERRRDEPLSNSTLHVSFEKTPKSNDSLIQLC